MTLAELVDRRAPGASAGLCYLCGVATAQGHREAPSDSFTAWPSCYAGSVICERCYPMLKDRRFRACSWVAESGMVTFCRGRLRGRLWRALLDPPAPPFALYATRGGQKQAWIGMLRYVSTSRDSYSVGTDWTDRPVFIARAWAAETAPWLLRLRKREVPRTALLSGAFSMRFWDAAWRGTWAADLERAQALIRDPRWEVLVHAVR